MCEAIVSLAKGFVLGFVCRRNRCLWLSLFGNADRCAHAKLKMAKSHGLCVSALHKMLPSFNVPSAFYAIENHSVAKRCTVLLHHDCIISGLPLRSPMALCKTHFAPLPRFASSGRITSSRRISWSRFIMKILFCSSFRASESDIYFFQGSFDNVQATATHSRDLFRHPVSPHNLSQHSLSNAADTS